MPKALTNKQLAETVRIVAKHGSGTAAKMLGISQSNVCWRINRAKKLGIQAEPKPPAKAKLREAKPLAAAEKLEAKQQTEKARRFWWQKYVDGGRKDEGLLHILLSKECDWLKQLAGVRYMACSRHIPLEDFYQEGYLGMVDAAKRYDPARGLKFQTYATPRTFGAMQDLIRSIDPVSRLKRRKGHKRTEVATALRNQLGRDPSDDELCEAMGLTYAQFTGGLPEDTASIEAANEDENSKIYNVGQTLRAMCDDPSSQTSFENFCRRIFSSLSMDHQAMCWLYFVRGATMKKIAEAFDLSESRVSQMFTQNIKEGLFKRLRKDDDVLDELRELAG